MSKVLIVDFYASGHNCDYLKGVLQANASNEIVAIYPEQIANAHATYLCKANQPAKGVMAYCAFIRLLRSVIRREKPDIIHILTGDILYRGLGLGLSVLPTNRTIITFHHIRNGKLQQWSLRNIARHAAKCIVHTEPLKYQMEEIGIHQSIVVEYPHFHAPAKEKQTETRKKLGISQDVTLIGAFGGTRFDKGLDILLEALGRLERNLPFHLLIAGKAVDFDEDYIAQATESYAEQVTKIIKPIEDEAYENYMNAVDVVALPYRRSFNGASGPLTEGTYYGKCIIGPAYGNIGRQIKEHHLGYTFSDENSESLAEALSIAITHPWKVDAEFKQFSQLLAPEDFQKKYMTIYDSIIHHGG